MPSRSLTIPSTPLAAGVAREEVTAMTEDMTDDQSHRAVLMTSEIVSNSVQHAGLGEFDLIRLSMELTERALSVSVSDDGPGFDLPSPPSRETSGPSWGLVMVEHMSNRWGIRKDPTSVWFEIDR